MASDGDGPEDELVLGQSTRLVAENVVNLCQLLGELHRLYFAANKLSSFAIEVHHSSVFLHNKFGIDDLAGLTQHDHIKGKVAD